MEIKVRGGKNLAQEDKVEGWLTSARNFTWERMNKGGIAGSGSTQKEGQDEPPTNDNLEGKPVPKDDTEEKWNGKAAQDATSSGQGKQAS